MVVDLRSVLEYRSNHWRRTQREYGDNINRIPHEVIDVKRYDTDVRDGVLFLEADESWVEVGPMDDICELLGGETYTLDYDNRQRQVGWLDTDEDGTITFDVRETLTDMDYDREFIRNIADVDADRTDDDGYPLRVSVFTDMMQTIWDSKGNL